MACPEWGNNKVHTTINRVNDMFPGACPAWGNNRVHTPINKINRRFPVACTAWQGFRAMSGMGWE